MSDTAGESFLRPTTAERLFNRIFGVLIGLGLGLKHNYLLQVRGRKSGRIYSTPVDVLEVEGRLFLVCGRGRAQWVSNAEASGRVTLRKGSWRRDFGLSPVPDEQKPELLKRYIERFKLTVQRYFPVPAGSPTNAFASVAPRYPVFELIPTGSALSP
jgi:deazaflavin-dependent oxidoreductase (nitroreductase family)